MDIKRIAELKMLAHNGVFCADNRTLRDLLAEVEQLQAGLDTLMYETRSLQVSLRLERAEVERQANEIERLNRLLESLAPVGSEFHNNPERCVEWAKVQQETNHRVTINSMKRTREAEAEVERLRAELNHARADRDAWLQKYQAEVKALRQWQQQARRVLNCLSIYATQEGFSDMQAMIYPVLAQAKGE